jgi:hypothetical protein
MIPLTVDKCVVAAKINESISKVGVLFGGVGGKVGHTPGLITVFVFTAMF